MVAPLRVLALVKQIPVFEEMRLRADGRLERDGLPLEMNAYCRRAVAKGVELARASGGTCTVLTLGPPSAEDVLREAIAFGADGGVLVSDPAFAGSDTLVTARAIAATIELLEREHGRFDLVLAGRNSVDADTGQVGPEVAQLLDLPFAAGVKSLELVERAATGDGDEGWSAVVGLEHDDLWIDATVLLPAVLSTAERLIDPCKIKDPAVWATVDAHRIRRLSALDLGPGPWGQGGSPTTVGQTRHEAIDRQRVRLSGPVVEQVREAVALLRDRGALHPGTLHDEVDEVVPDTPGDGGPAERIAVVVEPERERLTRELLSGAVRVRLEAGAGRVVAIGPGAGDDAERLAAWGADAVVSIDGSAVEEDVAAALIGWIGEVQPSVVLAGGTAWGREVASRVAAALGLGLTGDAVGFAVEGGRLVAWKPAFGGTLVAAIRSSSPVQMATVRAGVLGTFAPRRVGSAPPMETISAASRGRVVVTGRRREDDVDRFLNAEMIIGVGLGVDPAHYGELTPLQELLGAEIGATRKVTDKGYLPRARQIGITGHILSPRLFIAIGTSGKYNHMVGVRSAGTVLAINPDPDSLVFDVSDIGIVGDWREVVPELEQQLRAAMSTVH